MTEISATNYRDIKFTRDTKVDYNKGDAVVNTIFKKFDTNMDGEFNNEEWVKYNEYLFRQSQISKYITDVSNNTTRYYSSKVETLVAQYEDIDSRAKNVDWTIFEKLLEFERTHEIDRAGTIDGNIPDGAYRVNVRDLEMGIYDPEKGCFTGECYEEGYILGLEKLSESEQNEYLSLLEKASESAKLGREIDKEYEVLDNEISREMILLNYAQAGFINGAVSEEKAQRLVEIYNNANPFNEEIKNIEQRRQQLWLKGNKTEEDLLLLEQYDIQLRQLKQASLTWSISDADESVIAQLKNEGFTSQLTPFQLTYQDERLTNTTSGKFNYQDDNWNIEGNFSNSVSVDKEFNIYHSYLATLDTRYGWDELKFRSLSSINSQEQMRTISQSFSSDYGNISAGIGEEIITVNTDEASDVTTYTTTANVGYNTESFSANISGSITPREVTESNEIGQEVTRNFVDYSVNGSFVYRTGVFTNTANIDLTRDNKNYSLASNVDYSTNLGKNVTFSTNSSFTSRYNSTLNSFELSPNSTITLGYNKGDFSGNLTLLEQYSTVLENGSRPVSNHNFTANGGVSFKGFSANFQFNDTDSPMAHSNTYGLKLSHDFGNYGRLGLEGSYQKTKNKIEPNVDENITVSANYTLNF